MTTLLGGKYVLEQRLGGGGMAEVFLGRTVGAEGFTRQVAIKRVLAGYSESPQFAQMFVAEARLSSRLQHPNVVSVLDFDRDTAGALFLVMELVEGTDLDGLLGTGALPLPAIIHITCEVLRGLGYAHELPAGADGVRGLVHRDVSPHNVLLSWEGAVKVSDFGIAKARSASAATASEFIKGKPAYMSPEQANGEWLDGRSDLFAVGVMLWEMLSGRPLFAGQTTHETLARLLFAPIPSTRDVRADVPADVDAVALRLLAREREHRYPSAEAAIADLIACRDHPRSGRELLVPLLAQRFAGRAPQRARSVVSAGPEDPTAIAPPPPVLTPLPGPRAGGTPVMRMPPIASAPTTAIPSTWRRGRWAALAAFLVLGAGAGVFAASRGSASDSPSIDDRSTSGSAPSTTAPEPATPRRADATGDKKPTVEADQGSAQAAKPVDSPPPVVEPAAQGSSKQPIKRPLSPKRGPGTGSGPGSGIREIKLGG